MGNLATPTFKYRSDHCFSVFRIAHLKNMMFDALVSAQTHSTERPHLDARARTISIGGVLLCSSAIGALACINTIYTIHTKRGG